jgi:hypothetical protein
MMNLRKRDIWVHLSDEGRSALFYVKLPKEPVPLHVVEQDERGIWALVGSEQTGESESLIPVMLLKWQHIATVSLDWKRGDSDEIDIIIGNARS